MPVKLKPVVRKEKVGFQIMLPPIVIDFLNKYAEVPSKFIEETIKEAPYAYWAEYRKATEEVPSKKAGRLYSYWPDVQRQRFLGYFTVELVERLKPLTNPGVFVERVLVKVYGKRYFRETNVTKKRR